MTCDKHKKEPARGYSGCAGCEVERLNAGLASLRATIDRMTSENHRDALNGQATLDEANNEILRLRSVNAGIMVAMRHILTHMERNGMGQWSPAEMLRETIRCAYRAEQAETEPETCVWVERADAYWNTSCGLTWPPCSGPEKLVCPRCGKRIKQAGKAEGKQ